jgi:RhoGAP domain
MQGNYRNIKENDSSYNSIDSLAVLSEEPKKEKERLRDKVKMKFKLKSSRAATTQDSADAAKEIEEDYFCPNLETVEKATENNHVPKVVVECVGILEDDGNINTPGLYRVSGNKTQIEAFKKRGNDKKASRKETTQTFLKSQDVHCVTGILKLFFRELSPPLMPANIFASCTAGEYFNFKRKISDLH